MEAVHSITSHTRKDHLALALFSTVLAVGAAAAGIYFLVDYLQTKSLTGSGDTAPSPGDPTTEDPNNNTNGSNTDGPNTHGSNTDGPNTDGSNIDGPNTDGSNTNSDPNTNDPKPDDIDTAASMSTATRNIIIGAVVGGVLLIIALFILSRRLRRSGISEQRNKPNRLTFGIPSKPFSRMFGKTKPFGKKFFRQAEKGKDFKIANIAYPEKIPDYEWDINGNPRTVRALEAKMYNVRDFNMGVSYLASLAFPDKKFTVAEVRELDDALGSADYENAVQRSAKANELFESLMTPPADSAPDVQQQAHAFLTQAFGLSKDFSGSHEDAMSEMHKQAMDRKSRIEPGDPRYPKLEEQMQKELSLLAGSVDAHSKKIYEREKKFILTHDPFWKLKSHEQDELLDTDTPKSRVEYLLDTTKALYLSFMKEAPQDRQQELSEKATELKQVYGKGFESGLQRVQHYVWNGDLGERWGRINKRRE